MILLHLPKIPQFAYMQINRASRISIVLIVRIYTIFKIITKLDVSSWQECTAYCNVNGVDSFTKMFSANGFIPVNLQQLLSGRSPTFQLSKAGDFARQLFKPVKCCVNIILMRKDKNSTKIKLFIIRTDIKQQTVL